MTLGIWKLAARAALKTALDEKRFGPFVFEIDRPKGFVKEWPQDDGSVKRFKYPCDYGYFVDHTGEDDEGLDAFVGDDPSGPVESFMKLKPDEDGKMVEDETKFLIGLTPSQREKVLGLYADGEIRDLRAYDDVYELIDVLSEFRDKKASARLAARFLQAGSSEHKKSVALMKFLSGVARKEGVAKHVYVVGGAVRNYLLGVPIKDIDVVVDSVELGRGRDSEWFAKQVADAIPAPSSLVTNQYGVAILTVKGPWELDGIDLQGEVIEIANARKESYEGAGGKGKGYKPTDVSPATIQEDVFRREFTFNTLLWRLLDLADGPDKAEVIDLTGLGRAHLDEKLISTPVDPDKTFSDDPTRQLRILKFLLRYGLKISPDVAASVKRNAPKLKQMPWEAVANILVHDILDSPRASEGLRVMRSLGMLDVLVEMIRDTPPFAAYMNRQLSSGNRPVALLLELADIGFSDKAMEFLTPPQKSRFKAISESLDPDEARKLLDALKRPPADNAAIIQEFALEGRDRGVLVSVARDVLIEDPSTLKNPVELNDRIRDRLRATLPARVASRHLEAENVTEIDPSLVKGLRAWVKQTFAPKSSYGSLSDLLGHLRTLHDRDLNRFWEYLFYNKGLLPRGAGFDNAIQKMSVKVGQEIKEARDILGDLIEKVQHTFDAMTPGTGTYKMDQMQGSYSVLHFYQQINSKDPFIPALRGYDAEARETILKVEAILSGKVLRAISAFLNKYADDQPFESEEILLEYDIGRVKLVYDGVPDPHLISRPESANPRRLADYIPYFMKAKALLDRRGFSDLWYGPMFVGCPKCGGENPLGKKFGVGAHYMTGRDEITVYLEPKPYLVQLLIHELGHRYYFKFMDQGDRARFDSFYKEVAAVSEYGGTTTEEDFAEVFSHFVLGQDMTRDQIERFKAFLAKKDRGRFAGVAPRYITGADDNEPTNESLWEKCKETAKARYTKWPSAYAVGHALKLYKDEGGGWKKKATLSHEARGKAKKDVGHGGLDEWFSGHGEGKSKGEGDATWGDWVAISPVKKKIETELADGTLKTETIYPGDIVGPCGVSEDANWKDVTKGGKDPLKCMPRQKAHDMDKSERAELAKAKMKAEKSEGNGKKPVMTPTFQKDKEAAILAERVATRALAAAGKYDDIDFKPPESVAAEAKKGLEYREKASPSNKGGLTPAEASEQGIGSGVQRAVNLKNRDNVTPETIDKMVGFFSRHEKNKGIAPENRDEPWNDKGYVSWLLWGGDPGKSWAEKVKAQMDKADGGKKSYDKGSLESLCARKVMGNNLRSKIIRLAHANPELRKDLLPLLQSEQPTGRTATGLTWGRQLSEVKEKFLEEVVKEATDILQNEGATAHGKVTGGTATVVGASADGQKIEIRWQWGRGDAEIQSEMRMGTQKRSGKHLVLSMGAMNVASESLYSHFQGLLP